MSVRRRRWWRWRDWPGWPVRLVGVALAGVALAVPLLAAGAAPAVASGAGPAAAPGAGRLPADSGAATGATVTVALVDGGLSPDAPTVLDVAGQGFQVVQGGFGGIYVLFGWVDDPAGGTWRPSAGGVSGDDYRYAVDDQSRDNAGYQVFVAFPGSSTQAQANGGELAADGSWSARLTVPGASLTALDAAGNPVPVDCRVVTCGVITVGAHGVANAHNETFTPVGFRAAAASTDAATPSAAPTAASTGATAAAGPPAGPWASAGPAPTLSPTSPPAVAGGATSASSGRPVAAPVAALLVVLVVLAAGAGGALVVQRRRRAAAGTAPGAAAGTAPGSATGTAPGSATGTAADPAGSTTDPTDGDAA